MKLGFWEGFRVPFQNYGRTWWWLWIVPYILAVFSIMAKFVLFVGESFIDWPFTTLPSPPSLGFIITLGIIAIPCILIFLGYQAKVMRAFSQGSFEGLPETPSLGDALRYGFFFFLFVLTVSVVSSVLAAIPIIGWIFQILAMLLMIIMMFQFVQNYSFSEGWDVKRAFNIIKNDFLGYLSAILKTIGLSLIYVVLCIPIVTIPFLYGPMTFGSIVFLAEFYSNSSQ